MANALTRTVIETIVRKTITDIKDSPKRSVRNFVDLAMTCMKGRFQSHFLQMAQTMLKNENSSYYRLISDVVKSADTDRIVTFGMNIGYNSCTVGARTIRALEQKEHFNIPWSVTLEIPGETYPQREADYRSVLQQGKALGIYTWMIYAPNATDRLLSLVEEHPECAFIIYCSPEEITGALLDRAGKINHLVFAVHHAPGVEDACQLLRDGHFFHAIYYTYGESDVDDILNGRLLRDAEPLHPVFTAFLARPECSERTVQTVYQYINEMRKGQQYSTMPWDILNDNRFVDSIISEDSCSAGFDAEGYLLTARNAQRLSDYNLFRQPLADIFRMAFPKDDNPAQTAPVTV